MAFRLSADSARAAPVLRRIKSHDPTPHITHKVSYHRTCAWPSPSDYAEFSAAPAAASSFGAARVDETTWPIPRMSSYWTRLHRVFQCSRSSSSFVRAWTGCSTRRRRGSTQPHEKPLRPPREARFARLRSRRDRRHVRHAVGRARDGPRRSRRKDRRARVLSTHLINSQQSVSWYNFFQKSES